MKALVNALSEGTYWFINHQFREYYFQKAIWIEKTLRKATIASNSELLFAIVIWLVFKKTFQIFCIKMAAIVLKLL